MIGCDLCGPFPNGQHLLVCVDYHNRFPEVEIVCKTTSRVIASKLRKLICYGCPEVIITDNGPQFQKNTEFKSLLHEFGIKHCRVTPYHPQANGEVERFNRNLKKCNQTAIGEHQDWRIALENFLLSYRSTIHATTTGMTPAEMMFGRPIKDKLPQIPCKNTTQAYVAHDTLQKGKMKAYADKIRHAIPNMLKPGDTVLVKNQNKHRNKFTSRWNPCPGTIKNVKGNSVIVEHNNKSIISTSSHVKPYKFQQQTTNGKLNSICYDSDSTSDERVTSDDCSNTTIETVAYDFQNDSPNVTHNISSHDGEVMSGWPLFFPTGIPGHFQDFQDIFDHFSMTI